MKLWQSNAQVKILEVLKQYDFVQAVILKGSCANESIEIDKWSDIDLSIIVNDEHINKVFPDINWILPMGGIFALEQSTSDEIMVSRICFDDFIRFDLVFVKSSIFNRREGLDNLFGKVNRILYSKIPDIVRIIEKVSQQKAFKKLEKDSFKRMADNFWFIGVSAISKLVRGDFLIGSHLALEMAQNCIVLQMMIRDSAKGSNIHRTGDFENVEILGSIGALVHLKSPKNILNIIEESGKVFDKLALEYDNEYVGRCGIFKKWILEAEMDLENNL